ncbi:MAG: GNAT family N-acetyltransferase [Bacteroidales bacterium]
MNEVRTYRDSDFQDILELLKSNMEYDSWSDELLKEKLYMDPEWKADHCFIVEDTGKVIGFLQGVLRTVREEDIAYIKLFAVDHSKRRKGVGTLLLKAFETLIQEMGIKKIRVFDVPLNYHMPGVDPRYTPAVCFLEKNGFVNTGEAINMEVDLLDRSWDVKTKIDSLKSQGITISRIQPEKWNELMVLISDEWKLWAYELEMAFRMDPPAIFVAEYEGRIKAFSAYDGNNQGTGWFGPMGTHPDLRGKGVGNVLLYLCLEDMKKQGHQKSTIPWVGPVSFYSHFAGAKISRLFWRYEKKIDKHK